MHIANIKEWWQEAFFIVAWEIKKMNKHSCCKPINFKTFPGVEEKWAENFSWIFSEQDLCHVH